MFIKENLTRAISGFGSSLLSINGLIGTGIFVLPAVLASKSIAFSPFVFLICGLIFASIVYCFAKLSSLFENTGGPVVYTSEAFGKFFGFQTGWVLFLGGVIATSANTVVLTKLMQKFFPVLEGGPIRTLFIVGVLLFLTLPTLVGVGKGMRMVAFFSFFKLVPLLGFVFLAIPHLNVNQLAVSGGATASLSTIWEALFIAVYAFIGFEGPVIPAGEAKKPKTSISTALVRTFIFVTVLYFMIQWACIALLPGVASSGSPIADAGGVLFGSAGVVLFSVVMAISVLGNLSSAVLVGPRNPYALALYGGLPQFLANVHPKYHVPTAATLLYSGVAVVLASTGSFVTLAAMASLVKILAYIFCMLALMKLQARRPDFNYGMLVVPAIGVILCMGLTVKAKPMGWALTAGAILIGSVLYWVRQAAIKTETSSVLPLKPQS